MIGLALHKAPGSIHGVLETHGGIAPLLRTRAARAMTAKEREEISRGLVSGMTLRAIAAQLRRAPSTISRELARNGGAGRYRALAADERAWAEARRPKLCHLAKHNRLRNIFARKINDNWSPQQIAGWLEVEHGKDPAMRVSHETIYKSLFIQSRGVLKKELIAHLRTRRMMRRGKTSTTGGQTRGQIIDAVSIKDRPAEIEDRAIPGHWEGDLITGSGNSHIATLVERHSRYLMLVKVRGKDTKTVVDALVRQVKRLPDGLMTSLTWDRGTELAHHKRFTVSTDVKVYFCDPKSPWQRGTNENTNRLLRQYFPHGTSLSTFSQMDLNAIARSMNSRPRKTLAYSTPAATLQAHVASTG